MLDKSVLSKNLKEFEKKKSQKKLAKPVKELDIDNESIDVNKELPDTHLYKRRNADSRKKERP